MAYPPQSMVNDDAGSAGVPVHQRGSITPGTGLFQSAVVFVAVFMSGAMPTVGKDTS